MRFVAHTQEKVCLKFFTIRIHTGPTTANTAVNTNALDKTLKHKVTMTNAPNVVKKTITHPVKRNVAAEAVVNAPPMTDGPTERIAWSAREARR